MELKEGMYVRTKRGLIAKYIGFEKDEEENEYSKYNFNGKIYWYYEYYNDYVYEEDFEEWFEASVIKISNNIIDLIEVGDILEINNEKYEVIYDKSYEKLGILIPSREELSIRHSALEYVFKKYKVSIVTKEQFSQMEYKISLEG